MRRLPVVILTWTLFAAVMLAIGWVLKQVVPPISAWLEQELGQLGSTIVVFAFLAICGGLLLLVPRFKARRSRLTARH